MDSEFSTPNRPKGIGDDKSYISTAVLIGAVLGQVFFGLLADRIGRRKGFIITLSLVICGSILSALAFPYDRTSLYLTHTPSGSGSAPSSTPSPCSASCWASALGASTRSRPLSLPSHLPHRPAGVPQRLCSRCKGARLHPFVLVLCVASLALEGSLIRGLQMGFVCCSVNRMRSPLRSARSGDRMAFVSGHWCRARPVYRLLSL